MEAIIMVKGQSLRCCNPDSIGLLYLKMFTFRDGSRPVPLTKTHKHVPYFFYYPSSLTTARAPHHQKPQVYDSSSFPILISTPHTQTRFSSTHSSLATTSSLAIPSSPPPWVTAWLPEARKQRHARRTQSHRQTLRLADDSDRHDHRQHRFVRNFRSGSLSPDL